MRSTSARSTRTASFVLSGVAAWAGFCGAVAHGGPTVIWRADNGFQFGGQNNSPGAAGGNVGGSNSTVVGDGEATVTQSSRNNRGGDDNTVVNIGGDLPWWLSPSPDGQQSSPGAATGGENNQGGDGNFVVNVGG